MALLDRRREDGDFIRPARFQHKAAPCGIDAGERPEQGAQPCDLDAQARAMGFIGMACAEGPGEENVAGHIMGCGFGKGAGKGKEHGPGGEGYDCLLPAYDVAIGINDESAGGQKGLDLTETQPTLFAAINAPGDGPIEHGDGIVDFGAKAGDTGGLSG